MVAKLAHDVVYFVKESSSNEELVYSLRSLEKNWSYKSVWFCGGCPAVLEPDHHLKIKQIGLNKWEKVRYSIKLVCLNNKIPEDFWLFNDDFFILKPFRNPRPQYNGTLSDYIESIKMKHAGSHSQYTLRLLAAIKALEEVGYTTLNYEVHKPMLINRKKALEVLDRFPEYGSFRSLYGNYWKIGGVDCPDMKINDTVGIGDKNWGFLSTSDNSFRNGEVGAYIRNQFKERSRFEI